MTIEIQNGTVISRFYSDGTGELLAVFQYEDDADRWANMMVKSEHHITGTTLYRTNLYSGISRVFFRERKAGNDI